MKKSIRLLTKIIRIVPLIILCFTISCQKKGKETSAKKETKTLVNSPDRKSFMLGMITAFAECIAGECKKCAFSPPFYPEDYEILKPEAVRIAKEQGIHLWLEENNDIKEDFRVHWWIMYKFPEILKEYQAIREKGFNPAWEFDKFRNLLSYGIVWGEGADKVIPKMREKETIMGTVSRILFKPGDWPLKKEARLR